MFQDLEGDKAKTFYDVTLISVDFDFGITSNPELFKKFDVKSDSLVLFKKVIPIPLALQFATAIGGFFDSSHWCKSSIYRKRWVSESFLQLNRELQWVQHFRIRFFFMFIILSYPSFPCLLRMKKSRNKSNLIQMILWQTKVSESACSLNVIDTTWGPIYFLTCKNLIRFRWISVLFPHLTAIGLCYHQSLGTVKPIRLKDLKEQNIQCVPELE